MYLLKRFRQGCSMCCFALVWILFMMVCLAAPQEGVSRCVTIVEEETQCMVVGKESVSVPIRGGSYSLSGTIAATDHQVFLSVKHCAKATLLLPGLAVQTRNVLGRVLRL